VHHFPVGDDGFDKRFSGRVGFLHQPQEVFPHLSRLVIEAEHLLPAHPGLLPAAQFEQRPAVILDNLIDNVKVRRIGRNPHPGTNREDIDGGPRL